MRQVDKLDQGVTTAGIEIPKELAGSIKDTLGKIIAIDNSNQSLMTQELTNIQTELRKIRIGKQQEQNYGTEYGKYKEEGIFFDTKE